MQRVQDHKSSKSKGNQQQQVSKYKLVTAIFADAIAELDVSPGIETGFGATHDDVAFGYAFLQGLLHSRRQIVIPQLVENFLHHLLTSKGHLRFSSALSFNYSRELRRLVFVERLFQFWDYNCIPIARFDLLKNDHKESINVYSFEDDCIPFFFFLFWVSWPMDSRLL